ncbi:uncharacterized protein LY89DRAFT_726340 [Mollisia scopiformis]|uniref:Uncharacterized protein n=1 Tax=Mollisia scopiformis TaxID=149040 RepID=A0A132B2N9_MOLSC|nr:uncharacterized protein LY89DRAFT_726340 [Mollisia scopiformis]KUJ06665.1 hypothetical protein LY89DRAFT_726340 [Mollisia scopiformis]
MEEVSRISVSLVLMQESSTVKRRGSSRDPLRQVEQLGHLLKRNGSFRSPLTPPRFENHLNSPLLSPTFTKSGLSLRNGYHTSPAYATIQMRSQRVAKYARNVLILGLFLFVLHAFNPSHQLPSLSDSPRTQFSPWDALRVLESTQLGSFSPFIRRPRARVESRWIDLVGYKAEAGFAWERLATWKDRCFALGEKARASYFYRDGMPQSDSTETDWGNSTEALHADWVRYTGGFVEKKTGSGRTWQRWAMGSEPDYPDIRGNKGRLMLEIDQEAGQEMELDEVPDVIEDKGKKGIITKYGLHGSIRLIREVAATLKIQDENTVDEGLEIRVYGVHWPRLGVLMMTTTSDKFAGIFGLPHLNLNEPFFKTTQRLLNQTIRRTLEKDDHIPWLGKQTPQNASLDVPPRCEYVVYVQKHPVLRTTMHDWERPPIDCLYDDSIIDTQELQMTTVIFSPDCGFILESRGPGLFPPTNTQQWVCEAKPKPS